eukprot:12821162-Alexandrium_andersonii.AAC.1
MARESQSLISRTVKDASLPSSARKHSPLQPWAWYARPGGHLQAGYSPSSPVRSACTMTGT